MRRRNHLKQAWPPVSDRLDWDFIKGMGQGPSEWFGDPSADPSHGKSCEFCLDAESWGRFTLSGGKLGLPTTDDAVLLQMSAREIARNREEGRTPALGIHAHLSVLNRLREELGHQAWVPSEFADSLERLLDTRIAVDVFSGRNATLYFRRSYALLSDACIGTCSAGVMLGWSVSVECYSAMVAGRTMLEQIRELRDDTFELGAQVARACTGA